MTELGLSWAETVWGMPLMSLMLLMNQDVYAHDQNVITLGDKEMIDSLAKRGR